MTTVIKRTVNTETHHDIPTIQDESPLSQSRMRVPPPSAPSGTGPRGDIYRARMRGTDVAVRLVKSQHSLNMTSLISELNALHKMRHPNIVSPKKGWIE